MMKRITPALGVLALAACQTAPTDGVDAAAPAPSADPIPRSAIFGNPERTQGRISPDGGMISWLAPKDGVMNVWVAPAADPSDAKVITNDTFRGIRNHQWSPNSEFIYYTQDDGGDENFHVYAADVATGEVRDLTPIADGARAAIQAISPERPNEILVGINERNPQLSDLFLVDVTTGERTLVKENPGYAGWLIDNDLTPRFGFQQTPAGGSQVVSFDGEVVVDIPQEDSLTTFPIGFNQANDAVFMTDSRGRDKTALTRLDIATGALTVVAESEKADIASVITDPVSYEPIAYSVEHKRVEWTGLTEQAAEDIAFIKANLDGDLSLLASTDDLSKFVVYADDAQAPGIYYLYDRSEGDLETMFTTRPDLADATLQPMQAVAIEARDGLELVSYLTLPPGADADGDGRPENPVPMVLNVHGGPWARDSYGYNSWHQWLADRGYAVLSVNYRGSTGFGKGFMNAAVGEFAGKMHDDLIDGVNWAVAEGIADPDKVAIAGGSYGGYATLIGVTFTPETFACGVDIVGPSSLVTLIESFPEYWKPFLEFTWFKYVGDPEAPEERADMLARSAISRIDAIEDPLLIGQGENDPRVTKLESDQLVEAMDAKGLPVTYVNFPDEGHGFARPENRLAFYAVMEGFLGECLGGRSEPIGAAFEGSSVQVLHGAEYVPTLADAVAAHEAASAADDDAGEDGAEDAL